MIISGGFMSIRPILRRCSGASDGAGGGRGRRAIPSLGETPVAFVVLKLGAQVKAEEVAAFVDARVAKVQRPAAYEFVESLPRSGIGKVLKRELRERPCESNRRPGSSREVCIHEHLRREITLTEYRSRVGQVLGLSEWLDVSQAMIDQFADVTGDRQFIHVDPQAAARTPFGETIAHGFLTLSLLSRMSFSAVPGSQAQDVHHYGMNSVRFITPVKSGARIRGEFGLKGCTERAVWPVAVGTRCVRRIEHAEKPALIAEWLNVTVMLGVEMNVYTMLAIAIASNLATVYFMKLFSRPHAAVATLAMVVANLLTQWFLGRSFQSGMNVEMP